MAEDKKECENELLHVSEPEGKTSAGGGNKRCSQ